MDLFAHRQFPWWFLPYLGVLYVLGTAWLWVPVLFVVQSWRRRKITIRDLLVFTAVEAAAFYWLLQPAAQL